MESIQLELEFPQPTLGALLTVEEIFDRADQTLLESLREDRRLERKTGAIHAEPLGEYVCMWANTHGGGLIALGVADDGTMLGCNSLSQDQLNRLEKCQDHCPEAHCVTRRVAVQLPDGRADFVLLVRVDYRTNRVVKTVKGDVFARRGDEKRKLKPEEVRQLQIDKGEIDFEQEPCSLVYPDDFDRDAIQQFAQNVRAMCGIETELDDDTALVVKHLATKVGDKLVPNVACALLFAKEPDRFFPGCKIRFLRFDGDQEWSGERFNAVKDIWVENMPVPKLIQKAESILDSQVRTFSSLSKDGKFYTAPEYPKHAWYEAIVNACVHRSYANGLRNMTIFVKMFDNRLEIDSPGPFPPFITPDNLYGNSHPRNPKMMHAMYFMRFVKMAGEGTRRMRDTMKAANLPEPVFAEKQIDFSRVRVTLKNNIDQRREWVDTDAVAIVGAAIAASLGEDEKRILNFVAENKTINVTQAVRITSLAWETAKAKLEALADRRILERVHRTDIERDPKAHYRLTGKD
jgi:ATP-dependent DNA helicase RecG